MPIFVIALSFTNDVLYQLSYSGDEASPTT